MFQMPVRQRPDSPRSAAQRWGAGLAAASVLVWSGLAAAAPAPESFSELAKKVSPAVVHIASTQEVEAPRGLPGMPFNFLEGSPFEEFFKRFGSPQGQPESRHATAPGPGFILDAYGSVVPNKQKQKRS